MNKRPVFRNIEIELSLPEKLEAVAELIQTPNTRKAVEILLSNEGKFHCLFPANCKYFPCLNLSCNADELSNGHPLHRS